jgi:hypothetical protein
MKSKIPFIGLTLAALATLPQAATEWNYGAADMPCKFTMTGFTAAKLSDAPAGTSPNGYPWHVFADLTYQFVCDDLVIPYSVHQPVAKLFAGGVGIQSTYLHSGNAVISGSPFVSLTYNYALNQIVLAYTENGASRTKNFADPALAASLADAQAKWKARNTAKPASFEKWERPAAVSGAIAKFQQYDRSLFTISNVNSKYYTAFPFADASMASETSILSTPRAMFKITYNQDPRYFAYVFCFQGAKDGDPYNNPLIVGDAFDPLSKRDAWKIYSNLQYWNLLRLDKASPRNLGKDIFFLDFSQGGGNIHINAMLEVKLLEHISAQPTSSSNIVVGGPSMSGILARLALLYTMPANNVTGEDLGTKVSGYLSIDSPHQGASITPTLQKGVSDYASSANVNAWAEFFGETNSTIEQWEVLNVPASHQMLYAHFYRAYETCNSPPTTCAILGGTLTPAGSNTLGHDYFYDFLRTAGDYRKGITSVSIAYSNFFKPHRFINRQTGMWTGNISSGVSTAKEFGIKDSWDLHELAPGSTGDWYWRNRTNTQSPSVYPYASSNSAGSSHTMFFERHSAFETFKGTFVPIYSSLDLRGYDAYQYNGETEEQLAKYTPFDMVYFMKNPKNEYPAYFSHGNTGGVAEEFMRYEHIVFDGQLMASINGGLTLIGNKPGQKAVPAVLSVLLY